MRTRLNALSVSLRTLALVCLLPAASLAQQEQPAAKLIEETPQARDARMAWWREARFGMFIHWGLYAIPAGEWKDRKDHGEWIRDSARIPLEEYDKLVARFNPVKFDADAWVRLAKDAGMKYIVITSKHHDGFCLFDSQHTDFDVMSTPFKRDILKELAAACEKHGVRLCFYHSIMDWHHPDYLPRRPWEKNRGTEGASLDRYVEHMKKQLRELCTNYGDIGVLWFDGEWENSWTHARGVDLYNYVRGLKPNIIINNRVDVGREGMAGLTKGAQFAGDFGTPEQEIPATGLPGVDWETCMTMNDHWGYCRVDVNFKSTEDLIRKLADIASKGGNFLLNVGPTAEGEIPPQSVERMREIGAWMKVNGESIYGTQASPFRSLPWGRCTARPLPGGDTRIYLHVFDWPEDRKLVVPGLLNVVSDARLLASEAAGGEAGEVAYAWVNDELVLRLPKQAPNAIDSVVVLDVKGKPDVGLSPQITAASDIFIDALDVTIDSPQERVQVHYTTDGGAPTAASPAAAGPVKLSATTTVKARAFRDGKGASGVAEATFTKVQPREGVIAGDATPGVKYAYYEGRWDRLPDFATLKPARTGTIDDFVFTPRQRPEEFAFVYEALIKVPADGVYTFYTVSDDGSRLYIGDQLVVDSDGLHGAAEKSGRIPLGAGLHPLRVEYFNRTGGNMLEVWWSAAGQEKQRVPAAALYRP